VTYTDDGLFPQTTFRRRHPTGVRRNEQQMDLAFVDPVLATPTRLLRGLVRGSDPVESQAAAVRVLPKLTEIQRRILHLLATTPGGFTAKEMEGMNDFREYAANSVRKRTSELHQAGKIVQRGRREGCAVWIVAT